MDITKIKEEWSDDEFTIEYNDINSEVETKELKLTPITIKDIKASLKDQSRNNSLQNTNVLDEKGIKCSKPKDIQSFSLTNKPSDPKTKSLAHSIGFKNSGLITSSFKVKPRNDNKNILLNKQANISKFSVKFSSRILSHNKIFKPSYARVRPNNTTSFPFDGAKFLHTQVHSNPILQSLLKDIVSLNNQKDDEDEDIINREIAKLRSKNKLPSLNPEVSIKVEFNDSDYLEDSDDDSFSNCNSKSSENYGKDSGYDNESQNSESPEEDNRSEIHENGLENAVIVVEPEYVDLDRYFESNTNSNDKGKEADANINPVSKKVEGTASNETISKSTQNGEFACSHCNRTFKTKRSYAFHAKNHETCFNVALSNISCSTGITTIAKQGLSESVQQHKVDDPKQLQKHNIKKPSEKLQDADANINPVSKKVEETASNETISKSTQNGELACAHCNRTFKTKRSYALHAKNPKSCFNVALSNISCSTGITTITKQGLSKNVQQHKVDGTKQLQKQIDLQKPSEKPQEHKQFLVQKNNPISKSTVLLHCEICGKKFISHVVLEQHLKRYHSNIKQYSNRKRTRESSESDGVVEIIEIDSD